MSAGRGAVVILGVPLGVLLVAFGVDRDDLAMTITGVVFIVLSLALMVEEVTVARGGRR